MISWGFMKQRLLELDGCRGLLCLTVVAGHWIGSRMGWGNVNFSHSYISVDGFFILSGIVLSYIYKEKLDIGRKEFIKYAIHRIERLYPLHLLTFLLTYLIYRIYFKELPFQEPVATAIYNMLLIHGLGFASSWNWNDPSWSISVEFFTSVMLLPLLIRLKSRIKLISISLISYIIVYARHHNLEAATDVHFMILSSGLLKCIAGMSLGVLITNISKFTEKRDPPKILMTIMQTAAVGICSYFIYTKDDVHSYDGIVIMSFCYLFYTLINYSGFWSAIAANQVLVYFGNISFSIYLLHTPLMIAMDHIGFFNSSSRITQTYLFVSTLILISSITYKYFELPIYKKSKTITDYKIDRL
jgi:peptidoglycan/LPS O-acetylase OafA/YrhL